MKSLSIEEKVDLIIKQAEKHDITAYEFGNNTEISTFAAEQLLKRRTKKPGKKTINAMLEYIEGRIVGTQLEEKKVQKEPSFNHNSENGSPSIQEQIAESIIQKIMPELREMKKEIIKAILNMDIEISEMRNVQEELLRVQKELEKSQIDCTASVKILEGRL